MHGPEIRSRRSRGLALIVVLGILIALPACLASRGRKPPAPSLQNLDACLTREALVSPSKSDKERCISLLERYVDEQANDPVSDGAALQLCRFYMERGGFSAAYNLLLLFPERYPKSREKRLAALYLGICLYYLEETRESLDVLHRLAEDPEAVSLYVEAARYIAENYLKQNQLLSALTWYEKCDVRIQTEEARRALRERVLAVVSREGDRETMAQAEALFPRGFFHEAARLGTAAAAVRNGEVRLAENRLRELSDQHLDDLFTPAIQALVSGMAREVRPEVCTLGCLLPLSGRYGRYGSGILDALVLGAGAFGEGEGRSVAVRLLVRDTAGDPEEAVKHVRALAENPEVVGVVGPLLVNVSQACAREAQRTGLPMISLAQAEDVALEGDFVFQNGLTLRQQVNTLVEYAMEDLGISRFAVLFPDDEFGAIARDVYREKVLAMGAEVVSEVSYPKEETDFQEEIRALLGETYWREMKRREEEEKKREQMRRSNVSRFPKQALDESALESEQEDKPLIPPFGALFVPDQYRKASLIAPYLAFYDLNDVVLLGNNAWNSVHLLKEAGEYVRDAVFVDGFYAESQMPHVRRFVDAFEDAFGRKPRVLEAQGYDSLLILEDVFHQVHPKTRARFREALARTADYPGVSGSTSFDESGRSVKRLYLLTIHGNRIQEIPGR